MNNCPICNKKIFQSTLLTNLPLSSAHLYSEICTDYKKADFNAGVCTGCFHIFNQTPKTTGVYEAKDYITKVSVSQTMSSNLEIIKNWIHKNINITTLKNFRVLEIGSGSGEIASWFSSMGAIVYTIDPCIEGYENSNIIHSKQLFDKNFTKEKEPFDLVIARHVIEHIQDPKEFLHLIKKIVHEESFVYIEVPNGLTSLKENRIVDYFNDHVHHFSPISLIYLVQMCGFSIVSSLSILNNNHQGALIKPKNTNSNEIRQDIDIVELLEESKNKLNGIIEQCNKANNIIIYGAGAHSATFASQLDNNILSKIQFVWDKDKRKSNKYLPGVSVGISEPKKEISSDIIIINTSVLYKNEVENYIRKDLGLSNTILHL